MHQDNKRVIERLIDSVNSGDLAIIDDLIAPDCIYRSPGYPEYHGPEGFRDRVQSVRSAFPDIHIIIQDIIAEGDIVMERYTLTGTHR